MYENAVADGTKRVSTSSEEGGEEDTSGGQTELIENFIADQRREFEHRGESGPEPSGLGYRSNPIPRERDDNAAADDLADQYVRKAEQAKGRIFETPGESVFDGQLKGIIGKLPEFHIDSDYVHSAMVDENYIM